MRRLAVGRGLLALLMAASVGPWAGMLHAAARDSGAGWLVFGAAVISAIALSWRDPVLLRRLFVGVHVFVLGIPIALWMRCLFHPRWIGIVVFALALGASLAVTVLAIVFLDLDAALTYCAFKFMNFPELAARVTADPGVHSLAFAGEPSNPHSPRSAGDLRFVQRGCSDGIAIVGLRWDRRGGAFVADRHGSRWDALPVVAAGDNLVADCDADVLAIPDYQGDGVYLAKMSAPLAGRVLPFELHQNPRIVCFDPIRRRLWVLDEWSRVTAVDVDRMAVVGFARFPPYALTLGFDPRGDRLIVSTSRSLV